MNKRAKIEKQPSGKAQGVTEEQLKETSYLLEGGLRRVMPYEYTFTSTVKRRMLNKLLVDVMAHEFKSENREYYAAAITDGRIRINGEIVSLDHHLKHSDSISHRIHRHEPPVADQPVVLLSDPDDADCEFVAVNKPASLPVHPTGGYRHNTVQFVLAREHSLRRLFPVHRLDRLTSGVLVFAKNSRAAARISALIHSGEGGVAKEYLALVEGVFPPTEEPLLVDQPLDRTQGGRWQVSPRGKHARSTFRLLWSDADTRRSLVRCSPETGRTHQLRVHLQHLGFPIVGDPLYGKHANFSALAPGEILNSAGRSLADVAADSLVSCRDCRVAIAADPLSHQMYLCLHASRYKCQEFDFSAPDPPWATAPDP